MPGQLIGELQSASGRFDRVDVPDHVRDRDVRCRELLDEPLVARQPRDRQVIASFRHPASTAPTEGCHGVIVDFASRYHRNLCVEEVDERPEKTRLRLAPKTEDDEVVLREQGIDHLWNDRFVVPDDSRKQHFARLEFGHQVVAKLLFDISMRPLACGHFAPERAQDGRLRHAADLT